MPKVFDWKQRVIRLPYISILFRVHKDARARNKWFGKHPKPKPFIYFWLGPVLVICHRLHKRVK